MEVERSLNKGQLIFCTSMALLARSDLQFRVMENESLWFFFFCLDRGKLEEKRVFLLIFHALVFDWSIIPHR